jgi:predicted deacylase
MKQTSHSAETLTLARLPSGVAITTQCHRYEGDDSGPTVYVQAAQHGNELNGPDVCRRFHDRLLDADLRGTVIVVPVANPLAFDARSYRAPTRIDPVNANMNRVWPGDENGTIVERMAATLWDLIEESDALVDLHTGSPDFHPHVIYKHSDDDARTLADAFEIPLLLGERTDEDAPDEYEKRDFGGKLRTQATDAGIPAITPELGNSRELDEEAIQRGVQGLLNVCKHYGVLPDDPTDVVTHTTARNHLGRVVAQESGLFRLDPDLELGQRVSEGTTLGTIYDPTTFEELQVATSSHAGILYSVSREATVVEGETVASVALVD